MSLRLGAGAEADARDAVAALDGNAVGGEGPLVGQRAAFALFSGSLVSPQSGVAPQRVVRVDQCLDVRSGSLVDPGREEALGLVDVAGPRGTVIHVHGDLDVLGVLLAGGQILDLLQAGLIGLAGRHAAVDGDGAGVGNCAAGRGGIEDLAGGAGAAAEEAGVFVVLGVVLRVEHLDKALDLLVVAGVVLVEIADVQDDLRHLVDRVVAALRRGAVAGNTVHVDADLHTAAMAAIDAAVGGLGGDDELHLVPGILGAVEIFIDDGLPAHTVAVLLLNGAHHHDPVALGNQVQILHDPGAIGGGGHAALLVGAAPAIDDLVGFIALIGIGLPVFDVADAHGVNVGIQGDDLVAGTHPADDVAQLVELHLVIPQAFHFLGDAADDALFLAGFRGDGDHVPQELGHSGTIVLCGLLDGFEIHGVTSVCFPYFLSQQGGDLFSMLLSYHRERRCQTKNLDS